MTLKQLEYFLAIAETGSVTKASRNMNISQPPLSFQLKELENELNVQLFKRNKKNLTITKKGELLQKRAKEILNLVNNTIYELQIPENQPRASIRIGTVSSICNRILPEKIIEFRKMYPNADFEIFEGSSTKILQQLSNGFVNLGIIREPFNMSLYNTHPINDTALDEQSCDYFVTLASVKFYDEPSAESIKLIELKDKPLIIQRRYRDILINACRKKGFVPRILCQNDDISSSLSWAKFGIGIALAPYTSAIQNTSSELFIKRIDQPTLSSPAHLIWNKGFILPEEYRKFIQLFDQPRVSMGDGSQASCAPTARNEARSELKYHSRA